MSLLWLFMYGIPSQSQASVFDRSCTLCTQVLDISQDALKPHAESLAEDQIKPAGAKAKDKVKEAQDKIPQPDESRKVAEEKVGQASKQAAEAVKKNADPAAQKVPLII